MESTLKKDKFGTSMSGVFKKKLKSNHAFIGDEVLFKRKGLLLEGKVIGYRENVVIVEIDIKAASILGLASNLTVINHKNYQIK